MDCKDYYCNISSEAKWLNSKKWAIGDLFFGYRRQITVTEQSGNNLTDYRVLIELNSTNFDFSHVNGDGSDIRFHDENDFLNYWIEKWDSASQKAKIWVKVPSIPANGTTSFYMYYGNPNVVSASNGKDTFEFFDDFETDDGTWTLFGTNSAKDYEIIGFDKVNESPVIDSHQGIAISPDYYYTIHTDRIDKRSKDDWSIISLNTNPFGNISGVDHLGDGDYYNGKLYVPGEHWASETDWGNLHIFIYNADTLELERAIDISDNGHEGSGIVVVPEDNALYITEFKSGSDKIYKYSLSDFAYLGTINLSESIDYIQGITYREGLFYIATNSGKLYEVKRDGMVVRSYQLVSDVYSSEGLDFDTEGKLFWLQQMSNDTEHKVYIFKKASILHLPQFSSNVSGLDEGVYAQQTIETNMVIKTKMKINKTETLGVTGFYLSKNDPPGSDGYLVFGATDNGKFGIVDWKFDESDVVEYNEFTADYNNWHIWEIKKKGNEYTLFYDEENKGSITRTTTPKNYLVFGIPYNGNELWVDWVFVRKYTDPEPSVSIGDEETS